jgi:predicted aconitase
MVLNKEQQAILDGAAGEVMAKVMKTLVMYGDAFGAEKMVPVTSKYNHLVTSFGLKMMTPVFDLMQQLIDAGAVSGQKFSVDPRPLDKNVPANFLQNLVFNKFMYSTQEDYEEQLKALGLMNDKAFTCTCYLDEVGNKPQKGEVLSWAESSAVVYANSVLGARCNRNSGIMDIMGSIVGYVPYFGLLTDEGRKADWIIEVRCQNMPEPQLLGSAIGFKCIEDVPYIRGLDKWLGTELTQTVKDYLKDMGAAAASNGSVGLYHVENLTPEAVKHALAEGGNTLIKEDAKVFVIDDAEIERVKASYPNPWEGREYKEDAPQLAFAGCPHFSIEQLRDWTDRLVEGLNRHGNRRVTVNTIFCAAPDVREAFEKKYPVRARRLKRIGVTISGLCPLSYTSNPLTDKIRIITASNKLRYYSKARFYSEEELIEIITGGWDEKWR